MSKRAAIYARVSTSEQTKGYSLPSQIEGCLAYAKQHDLQVVTEIQESVSGATRLEDRKAGKELVALTERGQIDAIIVWRLDRLSRPPEDEYSRLLTTVEFFARHNVVIHNCETGEVKNDMTSVMITFFKGLAASQERAAIRERSMRGIEEKAKAGKYVGQGDPSYGYEKIGIKRESKLKIQRERAEIVKRIFYLYTDNNGRPLTYKKIAVLLTHEGVPTPGQVKKGGITGRGGWYPTTIRNIITKRIYIGELTVQGYTTFKPELVIIDQDTWNIAQNRRKTNQQRSRRNKKRNYLLASHLRCICGGALSGEAKVRRKGGFHLYYRCKKSRYDHIEHCDISYIRADEIEPLIWNWLIDLLTNPDHLRAGLQEMARKAQVMAKPARERLVIVDELSEKAKHDIHRLVSAFGDEGDSIVANALQEKVKEKQQLLASLKQEKASLLSVLPQNDFTPELQEEIIDLIGKVTGRLPNGSFERKRQLLNLLNLQAQLQRDENGGMVVKVSCHLLPNEQRIKYKGRRFKSGRPDRE